MASVTGPDSVSVPWGQQKKQTPTVTEPAPAPAPEPAPAPTQTAQPASPAPAPAPATQPAPAAAAPVAAAPVASSYTPAVQVQAMPERLRDLLVELRTVSGEETSLERVARDLASARSGQAAVRQDEAMLTAREIIVSASTSLVAQANHSQASARAILGSV